MEKHEIESMIRRRNDAGETLVLRKITNECVSSETIKRWSKIHFGGWAQAKQSAGCCGDVKKQYKDYDKEEVIQALQTYASEGVYEYKSGLPSGLIKRAVAIFGGFKAAKKAAGIDAPRKKKEEVHRVPDNILLDVVKISIEEGLTAKEAFSKYSGLYSAVHRVYGGLKQLKLSEGLEFPKKTRHTEGYRKYTDEELSSFVSEIVEKGMSGADANKYNSRLFGACRKRWVTWNRALIANGFEPTIRSPRKDWTREELKRIYLEEIQSGVRREDVSNKHAIRKLFGGITQLRAELGLSDSIEEPEKVLLSKISIDCYINQALKMDVDNLSEQLLDELDVNLAYSIKHHYGSTSNYFSILDIDRYKKPYTSFTWTKENIVWQLERWIREGYPVNYTAIQSRHKGIIVASRRLFGSYKKAFEYAGLNYDDYRIDTAMASRQGFEFEKVLAEILTDLGIEYLREPSINGCHPDFVIGKHWIDAKLSEWTVSFADCSTIHKYTPHCRRLTIVYLRKLKDETIRTNELGIDMIHVSELLKELPEDKAYIYQRKLDAILYALKENAA